MSTLLNVSPSPHAHGTETTQKLMMRVVIALVPAFLASVYFFGVGAIILTCVSIASCLIFEYLINRFLLKRPISINDGSAVVTGLLLAFNVPSNLPIHIIILGSLVAIGVGKMTFGGLGNNPFNPALVGRGFMVLSFPAQMTTWPIPQGFATSYIDATTGETALSLLKRGALDSLPSNADMFFGNIGGSLGEVSAIALLIGGIYLIIRKVISYHIPVSIIGTIAILTGILWLIDPTQYANPLFHILAGGVLLGAFFMATDYVTSPMNHKAQVIYGICIGVLIVVIRVWGSYPEGVSFAILIMNAFVPLLNRYIKIKPFGEEVNNG